MIIENKGQLLDAIRDKLDLSVPREQTLEFPQNFYAKEAEKILDEVLRTDGIAVFIQNHAGLSKNIQTDLLDWIKETDKKLVEHNPVN